MIEISRRFPAGVFVQASLLAGFTILLAGPWPVPDPLGLGNPFALTTWCAAVATVLWVPDLVAGRWARTPLDWILAAYIVVIAVTGLRGANQWQTFVSFLGTLGEIVLFYATVSIVRKVPGLRSVVLFVVAAEVAVLQIEALGYHAGLGLMSRPKEYPIPQGWSGYPELGAVAVLEVAVLLAAFVATSGIGSQIASGVLLLFTLGETVLLYSRTAWVAAGVVVLLGFAVAVRLHRSRRAWSLLAATAVLAAALVAGNPALRFLGANVLGRTATAAIVPEVAAPASRLHLWRETLEMIRDSPLSGVGLGNFRLVFESEYNPEVNSDGRRGVHAHNLWLHMTAELGIIGGLCVVALWVAVLRHAWRCVHAHAGFTTVAVFLALAGATVSNLTDAVPFGVAGARIQLLTWILFGLCAADQGGLPPARAVRVKKSSHGPRVPD